MAPDGHIFVLTDDDYMTMENVVQPLQNEEIAIIGNQPLQAWRDFDMDKAQDLLLDVMMPDLTVDALVLKAASMHDSMHDIINEIKHDERMDSIQKKTDKFHRRKAIRKISKI